MESNYTLLNRKNGIEYYVCANKKKKKCTSTLKKDTKLKTFTTTGHSRSCRHYSKKKEIFLQNTNAPIIISNTRGKYWKIPKYDANFHNICINSIHKAFDIKNMKFHDELIKENIKLPEKYLNSIQFLDPKDEEIFKIFKKFYTNNMYYGALKIVWIAGQNYAVETLDKIPSGTLLCEYTGRIMECSEEILESDDIMEYATYDQKEYVIFPKWEGNIARFISGINNQTDEGRKKQNLKSIKFRIDNDIHIALYTIKPIMKGDLLYFDYNQGTDKVFDEFRMDTSYYKY